MYPIPERQRQETRRQRLFRELMKAHRKYPRLNEYISMQKELDELTAAETR